MISIRFAPSGSPEMWAADHYRGRAACCMVLADCTKDLEARALFLAVAKSFEEIAKDAETLNGGALLN